MPRAVLALAAALASVGSVSAEHLVEPADVEIVGNWIAGLQYDDASLPSFGAVLERPASEPGSLHRVDPHRANLAVVGLLQSPVPTRLQIAERWIGWYLNHLNTESEPPGIIFDHWYRADGTGLRISEQSYHLFRSESFHFLCRCRNGW